MLDDTIVNNLARHWDEGWNRPDLATIMEPFSKDVIFSSPFITRLTGDPAKTHIQGYDTLESYIAGSLRDYGDIRYTLDATHVGAATVILVYTCHLPNGTDLPGADSMRVDLATNQVVEWRCHYKQGVALG